jgi:MFS family permease
VFKRRWLPVGLLALAMFLVNCLARFISWKAGIQDENSQNKLGIIGVLAVAVVIIVMSARWSIRYPFPRVFGEVMLAVSIGTLLSVLIGPVAGGLAPFSDSLAFAVYEILLFLVIGLVALFVGFMVVTALGKDWKSRGLKRYEQRFRHPRRAARG